MTHGGDERLLAAIRSTEPVREHAVLPMSGTCDSCGIDSWHPLHAVPDESLGALITCADCCVPCRQREQT